MSDYIYGSSLRAAKSKANYLFEGDFRRRPNQNLSGASRSMERGELLQQAAQQRQSREINRKREQAATKIQSLWRGYCIREDLREDMRSKFDYAIERLKSREDPYLLNEFIQMFVLHYHSGVDEHRFDRLVWFMLRYPDEIISWKDSDPNPWLYKITKLLNINLDLLSKYLTHKPSENYLLFFEYYTRPGKVLNDSQASKIWSALIDRGLYSKLRHMIDINRNLTSKPTNNEKDKSFIELIRRSLNFKPARDQSTYTFFKQFLHGPLCTHLDDFYLTELMKLQPIGLTPATILAAFRLHLASSPSRFGSSHYMTTAFSATTSSDEIKECTDSVWLCYSFVRTMYSSINELTDAEKTSYINILSRLVIPAEYITNISLLQAANKEDPEQNATDDDEIDPTATINQINQYHTKTNEVITRIIRIINDVPHINGLNSIIFNSDLQAKVQSAIVRICNLMLAHEPLAIFNCRLLYTVAFSKEFSRSLWKSIITLSGNNLFGKNTPVYLELTQGKNISHDLWEAILPQLKLFCSLYSYLLPTLDDVEFYSDNEELIFTSKDTPIEAAEKQNDNQARKTNSSFFIDKDLVNISAVLRDICVGFIELLYQDRHAHYNTTTKFNSSFHVAQTKLLSFEIKLCFKALVRLVSQLHARDSRKQFCPDGHWICPSVIIPANKALDFQLVSSQQGRLISQMTRDEKGSDRLQTTASEIKTVLILQEIPFVISFHDRVQIFHQLLRKEKLIHQSDGYHFGLPGTAIHVQIRRNYIYEDAFDKLSYLNEPNLKLPLKVSMINAVGADEAGIDGGGLSKEFLSELLKAGFDPMRGFFKSTKDQLLYPNPSANVLFASLPGGYEIHYEFLGRILGKAIFEKIMVELPLASFFMAKLLARKHSSDVDLHNLASLDPVLYKNLVYLKNYQGDVADLNLDFTISNNELGEHEVLELKPGGSKIPVTRENKIEYVHLVADYRLNKQIRAQCAAFKRGLSQLVDLDWLRMFDSRELQILVSGAPTMIDVEDWRRYTVYANGYTDDCDAINTFWRVTSGFDEIQKRKLLKFATSCSLPPLLGFKDLIPQFTIAATEETRLPTASTCMNLLKLPEIVDEATMRTKLLYAIESNSGFELS